MRAGLGVVLTTILALMLVFAAEAPARSGKPKVIYCDVRYLDDAVNFVVRWQSVNPVRKIKISAGTAAREFVIDEYDNVRNPSGYTGELAETLKLAGAKRKDAVEYVVQLEDDLRQRSDPHTGKVNIAPKTEAKDDGWGVGGSGAATAAASGQQASGTQLSLNATTTGIIGQVLDVMTRHDLPPVLDPLEIRTPARGRVVIAARAWDDKGLAKVVFRIFDPSANLVADQTIEGLGTFWQGTSKVFELAPGNYRIVAQAIDTGGNTSQERTESVLVEPPVPPQRQPHNATVMPGGGAAMMPGVNATQPTNSTGSN